MKTEQIIEDHLQRYPKLLIIDLIKLLHQSEFGPGHFIEDVNSSLERLEEELSKVKPRWEQGIEYIGNGLCRISLAAAKAWGLSPQTLNAFFVNTANAHKGTAEGLEEKFDTLRAMSREGKLPFKDEELEFVLQSYKETSYKAVRHSEVYADKYEPAYRVIDIKYTDFMSLFLNIDDKLTKKPNPVIAIDGNAASGKSSLADLLAEVYSCNVLRIDDFFVPFDKRTEERMAEVGGNVDYVRFEDEVITKIFFDEGFSYRIYNCKTNTFTDSDQIDPMKMSVVEGAYSLHPRFENMYDLKVFLAVDAKTQRERILRRDGPEMLKVFLSEWIPKENAYFDKYDIRSTCDLVYENPKA